MERTPGLDTIRAVCAAWVAMGHLGGPPLTAWADHATSAGSLAPGLYANFWNGPAAVIVFFVVSGYCIHAPFARTLRVPSLAGFALRRYLRVDLPLACAAAVSQQLGGRLSFFHDAILWSLAAELVYYTLYPALLAVRRAGVRWAAMAAAGFAAAVAVAASDPAAKNYPLFGLGLN